MKSGHFSVLQQLKSLWEREWLWACDAKEQEDALCSGGISVLQQTQRIQHPVMVELCTNHSYHRVTCTGNSPHCLILLIYLFFFSYIFPYGLSCHVHIGFYKYKRSQAPQPLPFGQWGAARFALHIIRHRARFPIKLQQPWLDLHLFQPF